MIRLRSQRRLTKPVAAMKIHPEVPVVVRVRVLVLDVHHEGIEEGLDAPPHVENVNEPCRANRQPALLVPSVVPRDRRRPLSVSAHRIGRRRRGTRSSSMERFVEVVLDELLDVVLEVDDDFAGHAELEQIQLMRTGPLPPHHQARRCWPAGGAS